MGLTKYRSFKDRFVDDGEEILAIVAGNFKPDFKNRNTIQLWDVSSGDIHSVDKWEGVTLTKYTSHEITLVNNSNRLTTVSFTPDYELIDEDSTDVLIGPNGSAHFYCTALMRNNVLYFVMRKGSQDKRNID